MQQAEFGRPEVDLAAAAADPMCRRVELQVAEFDRLIAKQRRAAAHDCLDASEQFTMREGLGEVIVGTGLQPGHLVEFLRAPGQHDDRNLLGAPLGAQLPEESHARRAREDPVEQHQVRNRSEEHTSELQSQSNLVCRLLLEKKKKATYVVSYSPIVS